MSRASSMCLIFCVFFFLIFVAEVSSIPVVDDNDSLIDIYSRRYTSIHTIDMICLMHSILESDQISFIGQ